MPILNLKEIRLHYREDGVGPDALIFVHALGTDLRIWDAVVAHASRRFRCLRYDLPGHGQTSFAGGHLSIQQLAADLSQFMDALGLARAALCGISIGGLVAQHMAIHEPERVSALILCDTALRIGSAAQWDERIRLVQSRGLADIADDVMKRWFKADFRDREPEVFAALRQGLIATTPDGYIGACHALRDADFSDLADRIDMPTVVLCGTDDMATPPEVAQLLASSIKGARFSLIPGAGHLPCIEAPGHVTEAIDLFLTEASLV